MHNSTDKIFLPDFCSLRMFFAVFFLAEILAFLLALASDFSKYGFLSELGIRSLFVLWVVLTSAAILCITRKYLAGFNHFTTGLIAFLIVQSITILVGWLVADGLPAWNLLPELVLKQNKGLFYFQILGVSSIVSVVFFRYLYVLYQWRRQVEAQAEARLDALQARMRPHFLFNSLNSIASLTRFEPQLAEKLIEDLAELIRASLQIDQARMIRLDEEIDLARLYLNIELQRMDHRFNTVWNLEALPMDALIPPLTLQPVMENAVYHGIELNPGQAEILIKGTIKFGTITLSVLNTLPPREKTNQRKGNRMAMDNVKARLKGAFSSDAQMFTSISDGFFTVTLVFPYRREQS